MHGIEYRRILMVSLSRRQKVNPAYSLRAFARDLQISASSISLILAGQQGLSVAKANLIADKIGLVSQERELFLLSVEGSHSRNLISKRLAQEKLIFAQAYFEKQQDHLLKNWLNLPIIEYIRSHPTVGLQSLGQLFETSDLEIKKILAVLRKEKIITRSKNKWSVKKDYMNFGSDVPSSIIRQFHNETLIRAMRSIEEQDLNERLLSTTVFNINPAKRATAFKVLAEFRRKFCVDFTSGEDINENSEVYTLALQFFRTHKGTK